MLNLSRAARLGAATAAALALSAPAAFAACPTRSFDPVFSDFNDGALYTLAPGGDFESAATDWTLSGGATLVADNPSRLAADAGDSTSLELASGASATSPEFCVAAGYPSARLFSEAVSRGRFGAWLLAEVLYADGSHQPVGLLGARPEWDATRKLSLAQGRFRRWFGADATASVRLRFTSLSGVTRIDDVYVDPRFRA